MHSQLKKRLTFANVVSVLALFLALGGVGYAAVKLKPNTVKAKHIKSGAVQTRHFAADANAPRAANAAQLDGKPSSDYQGYCEAGAIKGSVVVNTTAIAAGYSTVAGFNCSGGAVQMRRVALGEYYIRFVGNPGTGSAVGVSSGGAGISWNRETDPILTPAETVFRIRVFDTTNNTAIDNAFLSFLAF